MERERFRREGKGFSLKKITPATTTLKKWADILPPARDQIFLPQNFPASAARGLLPEKLAGGRKRRHWGLSERTWFGYLANQAAFRIVLPRGKLERLPEPQRQALKKAQLKIKNPAVVPSRFLPASLRERATHTWLTAGFFRGLRQNEKIAALKAWDKASKLSGRYPRVSPSSLPSPAKEILRKRGLSKLANTFAPRSGPNCFGAAAFSVAGKHLHRWMHPEPFFKVIGRAGLSLAVDGPRPGDILICRIGEQPVHAALYLGGFVFEKPGQDLYEPYRIVSWKRWLNDWRHTKFECWRN